MHKEYEVVTIKLENLHAGINWSAGGFIIIDGTSYYIEKIMGFNKKEVVFLGLFTKRKEELR